MGKNHLVLVNPQVEAIELQERLYRSFQITYFGITPFCGWMIWYFFEFFGFCFFFWDKLFNHLFQKSLLKMLTHERKFRRNNKFLAHRLRQRNKYWEMWQTKSLLLIISSQNGTLNYSISSRAKGWEGLLEDWKNSRVSSFKGATVCRGSMALQKYTFSGLLKEKKMLWSTPIQHFEVSHMCLLRKHKK